MSTSLLSPAPVTERERAWRTLGVGIAGLAALGGPLLAVGGLAPWIAVAAIALVVGTPAAAALAHAAPAAARDTDAVRTVLACTAGAAVAAAAPTGGPGAIGLWAAGTLAATALLARATLIADPRRARRGRRLAWRIAPVAALIAAILAPLPAWWGGAPVVAPWSALEPRWEAWSGWLAPAAVLGLWLPLAGATGGPVQGAAAARPSRLAVGGLLLVALALTVSTAAAYEAVASVSLTPTALAGPLPLLGLAIGAGALTLVDGRPWRLLGELAAWTAWFTLAGPTAGRWTWTLVAPGLLALRLGRAGVAATGTDRLLLLLAAAIAVGALGTGAPGVPADVPAAFTAAATVVILVWRVGWLRLQEAA